MYNPEAELLTLTDVDSARKRLSDSEHCVRTPVLHNVGYLLADTAQAGVTLHLKLENLQKTGCFKVRGVLNQLLQLPPNCGTPHRKLISMSAGNYGKSFAYLTRAMGLSGTIIMAESAPANRARVIESYGVQVERHPVERLEAVVAEHVKLYDSVYLHSFDDVQLMAGHASVGLEILEDVPDFDVLLICCGGGGLLSGVAAAVRLSGHKDCKIYGVEPQGSRTMYESFREKKPVSLPVNSVASGLSPPYAGPNAFRHCQQHVTDILLVSDAEILSSMLHLYEHGLVVEPSGAAAFAALHHGKVPDVAGKRVVVVITGGNVTTEEMSAHSTRVNETGEK